MKKVLIGSLFLAMGCGGGNNAPEVSSVSFNSLGFTGEGMQFAFFAGPVTELVDTDFDGTNDAEETQLVISISDRANFCDVLTVDPAVSALPDLKLGTLRVFIRGDIGTTAALVDAGSSLPVVQAEVQLTTEVSILQAGEAVYLGSSASAGDFDIEDISATNFVGSWSDTLALEVVSFQIISDPISATVPGATPCDALSSFFR